MLQKGVGAEFLGSLADVDEASSVLIGVPFDGTTSFAPGTRFGPNRMREASQNLETYSPRQDRALEEIAFVDLGDVALPFGNVTEALERVEAVSRHILAGGKRLAVMGGEHLITLPVVRACAASFKQLAVIQFDAHADLRDHYEGEHDSHATVMRRVGEVVGPESIFQIGIRSGTRDEYAFGRAHSGAFTEDLRTGVERALQELKDRPVYVSVDIDVVDPGYAPGTGTPEPGGCRPHELLEALLRLAVLDIVAFDVVEVNPLVDLHWTTSVLGAKVVREGLLAYFADEEDEA